MAGGFVAFEVRGLDTLDAALRALPEAVQGPLFAEALEAGGDVLLAGARARVRRRTGQLAGSLDLEIKTAGAAGQVKVGPSEKLAYRGRYLEFGVRPHAIPKRGKAKRLLASADRVFGRRVAHPGHPATPFLRPAVETDGPRAVDAFARTLWDGIVRETVRRGGTPE